MALKVLASSGVSFRTVKCSSCPRAGDSTGEAFRNEDVGDSVLMVVLLPVPRPLHRDLGPHPNDVRLAREDQGEWTSQRACAAHTPRRKQKGRAPSVTLTGVTSGNPANLCSWATCPMRTKGTAPSGPPRLPPQ